MKKGMAIIIMLVAVALLISVGVAVAAGSSGPKAGSTGSGDTSAAGKRAGNVYAASSQGEAQELRNANCTETQNGECSGDCVRDQSRLRERDCDGTCEGDGEKNQNRNSQQDKSTTS